jgi:hypothetical protein
MARDRMQLDSTEDGSLRVTRTLGMGRMGWMCRGWTVIPAVRPILPFQPFSVSVRTTNSTRSDCSERRFNQTRAVIVSAAEHRERR